mmetsp:Transcript_12586/g.25160  ORF Transcript_12586/g.25160 Transcript_12586/m.25160 type:complete len:781 (-) Transcript_12586:525-2867(-)
MVSKAASVKREREDGQVVWAKMKGFAAWPATVTGKNKKGSTDVLFLGSNDVGSVDDANIFDWAPHFATFRSKSKSKSFLSGVAAAQKLAESVGAAAVGTSKKRLKANAAVDSPISPKEQGPLVSASRRSSRRSAPHSSPQVKSELEVLGMTSIWNVLQDNGWTYAVGKARLLHPPFVKVAPNKKYLEGKEGEDYFVTDESLLVYLCENPIASIFTILTTAEKNSESSKEEKRSRPRASPEVKSEPAPRRAKSPAETVSADPPPSVGISEYEQLRLNKIARNEAMLRKLNIQPFSPADAAKPQRARAVRGLQGRGRNDAVPVIKRERSKRLAGKTPDGAELPADWKEPSASSMAEQTQGSVRKVGEMAIVDALREEGRGMRRKKQAAEEEETEELRAARRIATAGRFATTFAQLSIVGDGAASAAAVAGQDESAQQAAVCAFRCAERDVAKVVPERIFSLAFHPSTQKLLVAAGDKWGNLGLFDPDCADEAQAVTLFTPHSRPVSSLYFDSGAKLYSSSYDNTVRCLDVHAEKFVEVWAGDPDDFLAYSAFDESSSCMYAAYGSRQGGELERIDLRSGQSAWRLQLHAKKISCVDVHPLQPHILCTASNDTTVKLWDARKMGKKTKALDALASFQHGRAATSAHFSKRTGRKLLTTCYDDLVRVIDLKALDTEKGSKLPAVTAAARETRLRHDNQTGRWLTNFRAMWDPKSLEEERFVVGSMGRPRGIDVYMATPGGGGGSWSPVNLRDENFTTITSLNAFHPTLHALAGGNSSGKVSIFR